MSNTPRVPLYLQHPGIEKATKVENPSWESFRDHEIFKPQYREMEDRPSTQPIATLRRNPDGTLDFDWSKNMIIDAVHGLDYPAGLLPIQRALITVVFSGKVQVMEPQIADLMTQLSGTEKNKLRDMVEDHFKEEANWNAGFAGGSVPGRHITRVGA